MSDATKLPELTEEEARDSWVLTVAKDGTVSSVYCRDLAAVCAALKDSNGGRAG